MIGATGTGGGPCHRSTSRGWSGCWSGVRCRSRRGRVNGSRRTLPGRSRRRTPATARSRGWNGRTPSRSHRVRIADHGQRLVGLKGTGRQGMTVPGASTAAEGRTRTRAGTTVLRRVNVGIRTVETDTASTPDTSPGVGPGQSPPPGSRYPIVADPACRRGAGPGPRRRVCRTPRVRHPDRRVCRRVAPPSHSAQIARRTACRRESCDVVRVVPRLGA